MQLENLILDVILPTEMFCGMQAMRFIQGIALRIFIFLCSVNIVPIINATARIISEDNAFNETEDREKSRLLSFSESIDGIKRSFGEAPPCCLIKYLSYLFPCFFSTHKHGEVSSSLKMGENKKNTLNFPPDDVNLMVIGFLDYSDQLRLSHVNKRFGSLINEEFWAIQIENQRYVVWNYSLPLVKIFFANYFYQKGFGRHPSMPEGIVCNFDDISLLHNTLLARKALAMGYPKGKKNYEQSEHKRTMLLLDSNGSNGHTAFFVHQSMSEPIFGEYCA
ncbi:MAG: F-box protein [Alphaproteobacteria bacterium]